LNKNIRMKRVLVFILMIMVSSCDDGDVDIPAFEFQTTVQICGSYVLYRSNDDSTEALILQLSPGDFSETSITNIPLSAEVCSYRIFDSAFNQDYFCSDVPPVSPVVTRVW